MRYLEEVKEGWQHEPPRDRQRNQCGRNLNRSKSCLKIFRTFSTFTKRRIINKIIRGGTAVHGPNNQHVKYYFRHSNVATNTILSQLMEAVSRDKRLMLETTFGYKCSPRSEQDF